MSGCNLRHITKSSLFALILAALVQCGGDDGRAYAGAAWPHGPRLHNPFCKVPTFLEKRLLTQGQAFTDASGQPVIYIGRDEAMGDRAYRDFLMAHECCHHLRGHLARLKQERREQTFLSMSQVSRGFELDADCCAAAALAMTRRQGAIREAERRMQTFGAMPTGSGGYPSGDLRAMLIENCAANGNRPAPPLEPPASQSAAFGPSSGAE
jgi:hypothetical protein